MKRKFGIVFFILSTMTMSSCVNLPTTPESKYVWINASVEGALDNAERPSLKDDFYASVNYDEIRSLQFNEDDYSKGGIFNDSYAQVNEHMYDMLYENTSSVDQSQLNALREMIEEGDLETIKTEINSLNAANIVDFLLEDYFVYAVDGLINSYRYSETVPHIIIDISGLKYEKPYSIVYTILYYLYSSSYDYYSRYSVVGEAMPILFEYLANEVFDYGYEGCGQDIFDIELSLMQVYLDNYSYNYRQSTVGSISAFLTTDYPLTSMLRKDYSDSIRVFYNDATRYYLQAFDALTNDQKVLLLKNRLAVTNRCNYGLDKIKETKQLFRNALLSPNLNSLDDEHLVSMIFSEYYCTYADRAYAMTYSSTTIKNQILSFLNEIIAEYKVMLQEESWLGESTRNYAVEKLDAMRCDAMFDTSLLDYDFFPTSSTLFEAYTKYLKYSFSNRKEHYPSGEMWDYPSYFDNAFYSSQSNYFQLFQGLFDSIDFSNVSKEELYATVGMVAGHEISHGFDSNGANYDKNGSFRNWWTEADKKAFNERVNKVIRYFNKIELIPGVHCSGENLNAEATADMGGVKVALRLAKKVRNFDYDKFFKTYARIFALSYSRSHLDYYMNDSHPFPYLRINVTLSQFEEFHHTYNIKKGDGMYTAPKDRILVW